MLVATTDAIGAQMAGPAIRARHIAEALAADHDVVLVSTGPVTAALPGLVVEAVDDRRLRELVGGVDIVVLQGWVMAERPWLARSGTVVVVDVYDPMHLEQLEQARDAGPAGRLAAVADCAGVLNEQLLRGDFFVCASEKQRDLWLGHLASLGRINPATYDEDPSLRRLIDVAPFGVPVEPPVAAPGGGPGLRASIDGIGPDDPVVLWGGGIYNWFDPLTAIRAIDRVRADVPAVRLVFMGTQHPSPEVPAMAMAVAARQLAEELGLLGSHVFFNEGWVPYDERGAFLLDADVGISTHLDHVETAFSYRTRILDYLWAGLPVVCTAGDALAALVERDALGATVPPGDVDALAGALRRLLTDDGERAACRTRVAAAAPAHTWERALAPLVAFCAAPRRAPDLVDPAVRRRAVGPSVGPRPRHGVRAEWLRAADHLRDGGVGLLLRRVGSRLRRVVGGEQRGRAGRR